jgi:hypothetical protein
VLLATGAAQRVAGRHDIESRLFGQCREIICNVRNPWDVLVSWYLYQQQGKLEGRSFGEYLLWVFGDSRHNGHIYQTPLQFAEYATEYVKADTDLSGQLQTIMNRWGLPFTPVPHIGAAVDRTHYRDYYTPDLVELVKGHYGYRMNILDYEF